MTVDIVILSCAVKSVVDIYSNGKTAAFFCVGNFVKDHLIVSIGFDDLDRLRRYLCDLFKLFLFSHSNPVHSFGHSGAAGKLCHTVRA